MRKSDFKKNFENPSAAPKQLLALCDFQAASDDFYSGHFELTSKGKSTALAMFADDAEAAAQFALFGEEADGSAFGYWLYDDKTLADAPIVYLGSEGTGWAVLANSLNEFLSLLAVGAEDLGAAAFTSELQTADNPAPRLEQFRRWLKDEYRISAPEGTTSSIIDAARAAHPDLQNWLRQWQERREAAG